MANNVGATIKVTSAIEGQIQERSRSCMLRRVSSSTLLNLRPCECISIQAGEKAHVRVRMAVCTSERRLCIYFVVRETAREIEIAN